MKIQKGNTLLESNIFDPNANLTLIIRLFSVYPAMIIEGRLFWYVMKKSDRTRASFNTR